ncbi:hypothetical protein LRP67_07210 [Nocardioides sp. cx-169]|uniref:hypothetical protein n=1 Tax=Nocardioides sp. cx-169 TaxID=2899080 RepID=UPI001E3942A7|nr:hypothetical protein [Nocardioides sp. cx-169]MCD4533866.1 hypothetical protein [Nocardioides sp. cx-169]
MTTDRLRDLLHDQVSDVTTHDLSAAAWRHGQRIRRRRGIAVVGGTAAAALAVTVGVSVLDEPAGRPADLSTTTPAPTPGPTAEPDPRPTSSEPDARYAGAPVWVGPRPGEEADLPRLVGTGLPEEIDLSSGAPTAAGIGRAVGVLGVWPDGDLSRVVAVGADGSSYAVPVEGVLERVADAGGNVGSALTSESLSPGGRRAFFVQERSLEVYDFATGEWTSIATPPFLAEGAIWLTDSEIWVPESLGALSGTSYGVNGSEPVPSMVKSLGLAWPGAADGEPFGPLRSSSRAMAQSHFLSDGRDAVVAVVGKEPQVLVFDARSERWKGCCPVVGWAASGTVLFESRQEDARVLAWRVGSGDVRQVSRIIGWVAGQESYVASWSLPTG